MTGKESTHMDRHTRATHEEVVEIIASIWLQFVIRMDPSFLKKKKKIDIHRANGMDQFIYHYHLAQVDCLWSGSTT